MPDLNGLRRTGQGTRAMQLHAAHFVGPGSRILEYGLHHVPEVFLEMVLEGFASAIAEGQHPLRVSLHKIDQRRVLCKVLNDGGGTNLQMEQT